MEIQNSCWLLYVPYTLVQHKDIKVERNFHFSLIILTGSSASGKVPVTRQKQIRPFNHQLKVGKDITWPCYMGNWAAELTKNTLA